MVAGKGPVLLGYDGKLTSLTSDKRLCEPGCFRHLTGLFLNVRLSEVGCLDPSVCPNRAVPPHT